MAQIGVNGRLIDPLLQLMGELIQAICSVNIVEMLQSIEDRSPIRQKFVCVALIAEGSAVSELHPTY
jgi:hypothetical protein